MINRSSTAFALMVLTMLIIVTSFAVLETNWLEQQAFGNLEIIAKLKAESIERWYRERQSDCENLAQSNDIINNVNSLLLQPENRGARNLLLSRLTALTTVYDFASVMIADANGQLIQATDKQSSLNPATQQLIRDSSATRRIVHGELFLDNNNLELMDWVVPLLGSGNVEHPVVASLILRVHTADSLFPMINSWPSSSSSAESILLKQDNQSIRVLSKLRHAPNSTLQLINPLKGLELPPPTDSPTAGRIKAQDYRDVEVLAAYHPVSGSQWWIVVKQDYAETIQPIWHSLPWLIGILFAGKIVSFLLVRKFIKQHQQSQAILATLKDSVIMIDPTGMITQANQATGAMFGYEAANLPGQNVKILMPEPYHSAHDEYLRRHMASGEARIIGRRVEIVGRRANGQVFPIDLAVSELKTEHQHAYVGVIRDISEVKAQQQALEESESKLRNLFESTYEAIQLLDENGFIDCNPATLSLFGCESKALFCTRQPSDISPPTQASGIASDVLAKKMIQEAMSKGRHYFEWTHKRLDNGQTFQADVLLSKIQINGKVMLQAVVRDISDRLQLEAKNRRLERENTERLTSILNNLFVYVAFLDINGMIQDMNWAPLQRSNIRKEDVIGHYFPDTPWWSHDETMRSQLIQAMEKARQGISSRYDVKVMMAEQIVQLDFQIAPVYDSQQNIIGILPSAVDITHRTRYEEAIKHAEFLSDQALELARSGHWHIDFAEGDEFYNSSPRVIEIFGDPPREGHRYHIMNDWYVNIAAADKAAADATLANYLAAVDGKIERYDMIHPYRRPIDGRIIWIHVLGHIVRNAQNKATHVYGVVMDITTLKQAEEKAKRATFLSEQALELARSCHWFVDYELSPDYFTSSPRILEITGNSERENHRYHIMNDWYVNVAIVDQQAADAVLINYTDAINGDSPRFDMVHPYKRPDNGQLIWLHAIGEVFRDSEGRVRYVFGVMMDITSSKQAELVIREAKEAAEKATQIKSAFLANMSHEIRTPINAVLGFSQLALRDALPPRTESFLNKIHSSAEHLLGVINDILDFSKIEAGKLRIEQTDLCIDDILTHLHGMFDHKAREKNIELTLASLPNVPKHLLGDPLRLTQVLTNLLSNAVKFTDHGEISVLVNVLDQTEKRITLKFSILDSGIGMTEQQQIYLFQAFHQADTSTTRKYGGTGLGLAISHQLVQLMGGNLEVASQPGQGSCFSFSAQFDLLESPANETNLLSGKHVLVAEDSTIMSAALVNLLESLGCKAEECYSGEQLLAEYAAAPTVDLIIVDWHLPDMNGLELASKIQQLGTPPPLFLISGDEQVIQQEQQGKVFQQVIAKPINRLSLHSAMLATLVGDPVAPEKRKVAETVPQLSKHRILLVDDNAFNREVGLELVKETGAEVDTAENGQEAVDAVLSKHYDLVLMDIQMPVMDGYTATTHIKRQFPHLPIIAVTAHALSEEQAKVREFGMTDIITKPIRPQELFRTLEKCLGINQTPTPLEADEVLNPMPASQTTSSLLNLSGFDIATALERLDGDENLYRNFLKLFREHNQSLMAKIVADLETGNIEAVRRQIHTLKGSAGTIGASLLQVASADFESYLKTSPSAQESLESRQLATLKQQWAQTLDALINIDL